MKTLYGVALVLGSALLMAQDKYPASNQDSKNSNGEITVQGCVGRASGDYILTKKNPSITYELQATGKTRLKNYLGQRVEVTGNETTSMSTSSDAMNKTGSAAPTTIMVSSIRTVDKECEVRQTSDR